MELLELSTLPLPPAAGGGEEETLSLEALLDELGRRQWTHLLIEGGARVLSSFITQHLADELMVYVCPQAAEPPSCSPLPHLDIAEILKTLTPVESTHRAIGPDTLLRAVLYT